ncbi:MAG: hypothetical protein QHJ73_14035, partial [Armatimonadota bacterium]|nr:hypothetical protein [Armatimonadota bacterium]
MATTENDKTSSGPRRSAWVVPLLLLLITTGVFWEVRHLQFLNWDETIHVTANEYFDPVTPERVLRFWQRPFSGMYIPVVYTLWAGIAAFARNVPRPDGTFALNPSAFHTANLVVHLLNVLLAYSLLHRLVRKPWAAAAGAALFAIHPLQVEPVAWVPGFRDLVAAFFSLLALRLYVAMVDNPSATRRGILYPAAFVAFVLALLAKPGSAVVPFVALALHRWALGRPFLQGVRLLWPWWIASLPPQLITRSEQSFATPTPVWARPFIAGDALAFYLGKLAWPVGLCADYGRTPEEVLGHAWGYLTWLAPAVLGVLVWRGRARRPMLLAAAALFSLGLLPVLGFVPFIFQQFSTVADRYAYLALLGPAVALAWWLSTQRRPAAGVATSAVLAALGFLSAF